MAQGPQAFFSNPLLPLHLNASVPSIHRDPAYTPSAKGTPQPQDPERKVSWHVSDPERKVSWNASDPERKVSWHASEGQTPGMECCVKAAPPSSLKYGDRLRLWARCDVAIVIS